MEKKAIGYLKETASKLRNSKLKRLGGKEISALLDGVVEKLGLSSRDEAIMFTAIFDRSCSGRCSDLDDIASYFDCPQLEIMEYVRALKTLVRKGLVVQTDLSECRLVRQNFMATNYVIGCILDNRRPEFKEARIMQKEFDRYDFCKLVDSQIQDDDVTSESLFQFIEATENEYSEMPMIKELKEKIPSLPSRALFYEVCYDYFNNDGERNTDIDRTLKDMYESYGCRFRERKTLLDGSHPLIQAELIELTSDKDEIMLATDGQRLLLGNDFSAFGKQYHGLNRYAFVSEVNEYVHSKEHDTNHPNALVRLSKKIDVIEDACRNLKCIAKIKDLLEEADLRALFYIVCNACANANWFSVARELSALYPIKQRNQALKDFKEETHKLQRLDLVEMESKSSLFGEYTILQLTDKGKRLFFEEDAELFIEQIDKKELIATSDIKEKRLYFSANEQRQLAMVGNALQEENYKSLVARLEEKGLSKGLAILLYGAPGTGKTESVMQWARATGRDILHVDISSSKSMWFGESEKIIKDIFVRYRRLCKRSTLKPILLFNEADAIFSKRKDSSSSNVAQTENAIQNIILEEMENLDGILIATTNLAENLDRAFERRFLFKIQFDKPSVDAKQKIWADKLPWLTNDDSILLAQKYEFSGGEIDNITRKAIMSEIIDGQMPTIEQIVKLCDEEKISKRTAKVGF